MCLIALSDSGFQELAAEFWERACAANPDGFGLMFHGGGGPVVQKHETSCVRTLRLRLAALPLDVRVAVHLREATAGERGLANLHPHPCAGAASGVLVMHNGTLRSIPAHPNQGPSDTALFSSRWLPALLSVSNKPWNHDEHLRTIAAFAGPRNRFVFLDSAGSWQVLGEQDGFRVGRTWLSNPKARSWL